MTPMHSLTVSRGALVRLLVLAGAVSSAGSARAFVYQECDGKALRFKSDPIELRASSVSFPSNSSFMWALAGAVAEINLNPSKATLLVVLGDDSIALENGQNETAFTSDQALVGGALGVTYRTYDCGAGAIEEADVLFNSSHPWTSSSLKQAQVLYGGAGVPFGAIAAHELGHLLGLEHELRTYTIMLGWGHEHANGAYANGYFGEDASDGLVFLYGVDSPRRQNVSVAHWRVVEHEEMGMLGMFRTAVYDHPPPRYTPYTEMLTLVDGFVSWRENTSEPRFIVYNGQTIYPDFTYENCGADAQRVNVAYHLSPDATITTSDRRISTFTLDLNRGWVLTYARPVTLPTDLAEGTDHQLGVIVDHDGQIAETMNEGNNASYIGIRIGQTYPVALAFEPSHVDLGQSTTGWLTLKGAAPPGGVAITLYASDAYVTVPPSVVVPAGARFASFAVTTNAAFSGIGYHETVVSAYRPGVGGTAQGSLYVKLGTMVKPPSLATNCAFDPASPMCTLCQTSKIPLCDQILVDLEEPILPPEVPPFPGPPPPWTPVVHSPWSDAGPGPAGPSF
jgi:hypothetical protein